MRQRLTFLLILALIGALVSDVQGQRKPPRDPGSGPNPNPVPPGAAPNVPRDPGFPRDPNAPRAPREPRRQFDRDLRDRSIQFQNMSDYFEDRDARRIEDPVLVQRKQIIRRMLDEIDQKLQSLITETLKDSVQVDDDALKKPAGPKPENADTIGASALARLKGKGPGDLASEPDSEPGNPDLKPGIVVKIPLDPDLSPSQLSQMHSLLSAAVEPAEKQKLWLPSAFRFETGSLPAAGKDEQFFTITLEDASIANIRSGNGDRPGQSLSANFRSPAIRRRAPLLEYTSAPPSSLEMELMFGPSSKTDSWSKSSQPRLLFSFPGSQMEVNKEEKITIHGGRTENVRSGRLRGAGLLPSQPQQNDSVDPILTFTIDWGDGSPHQQAHSSLYFPESMLKEIQQLANVRGRLQWDSNSNTRTSGLIVSGSDVNFKSRSALESGGSLLGPASYQGRAVSPSQDAGPLWSSRSGGPVPAQTFHMKISIGGTDSPFDDYSFTADRTSSGLRDAGVGNFLTRGMWVDGVVREIDTGAARRGAAGFGPWEVSPKHVLNANNSPSPSVMFNPTQITFKKTVRWTKGATGTHSGDGISDSIWMDLSFPVSKANPERNRNIVLYGRHSPAAGVYDYPGEYAARFDGVDPAPIPIVVADNVPPASNALRAIAAAEGRRRLGPGGANFLFGDGSTPSRWKGFTTDGEGPDAASRLETVGALKMIKARTTAIDARRRYKVVMPYDQGPSSGAGGGVQYDETDLSFIQRLAEGGAGVAEQNDRRFWRPRNGNLLMFNDGDSAKPPMQVTSVPSHNQTHLEFLRTRAARIGHQPPEASSAKRSFYDALVVEATLPALDSTKNSSRDFFDATITSFDWPALDANARQSPIFKGEIISLEPSFPRSPSLDGEGNIGVIWFDTRRDPQKNDVNRLRNPGNPFVPQPWSYDVKMEGENVSSASTNDNSSTWIRTSQLALGGSMLVPSQTKVLVHAPASNSDSAATTGSRNGNLHLIEFTSGAILPSTVGVHESMTVGAAQSISVGAARTITVDGMRSISAGLNQSNSGTDNGGYPSQIRARRDAEKGADAPSEPFPTVDGIRVPEPAADSPPPPVGPKGIPVPFPVLTTTIKAHDGDPDVPIVSGRVYNGNTPGTHSNSSPFEAIQASFGTDSSTQNSGIRGYDKLHRLLRGRKSR